jgi:predicted HNH restriction endonuclease
MQSQPKHVNYRKLAFETYDPMCAHCGFGIPAVLEVAHIDRDRTNNMVNNLVILCPNCHKMYDLNLISTDVISQMRDRPKNVDWSVRMKDAGQKAATTRKWKRAGWKAAETRKRNRLIQQPTQASITIEADIAVPPSDGLLE